MKILNEVNPPLSEVLEHHGIKGMKWGVRRNPQTGARPIARTLNNSKFGKAANKNAERHMTKQNLKGKTHVIPTVRSAENQKANPHPAKSAAKSVGKGLVKGLNAAETAHFVVNANSPNNVQKVTEMAHKEYKAKDLPRINSKPEYVRASKLTNRLRHPLDPTTRAYRKEAKTAYIAQLEKAANSMRNVNGTWKYTIKDSQGKLPTSSLFWKVHPEAVHHADGMDSDFTVEVIMDENGFITGLKPVDNVAHLQDLGVEFLAHLGLKTS